jgi:hypothetical protein
VRIVLSRLARRLKPAPWTLWLVLSAVLFLASSASFGLAGAHHEAQLGIMGALIAVAMILTFSR